MLVMVGHLSSGASSPEITRAHQTGRVRWPGILLPLPDFASQLAVARLDPGGLSRYPEDVFIVCACLLGIDRAVDQFERDYLQPILPALRRFDLSQDRLDEIAQIHRAKLFSNPAPRIAAYSASGPLLAWLRVGLTRTALDHIRQADRYAPLQPELVDEVLQETVTPETRLLLDDSRSVLKAAIESTLARLSARDRTFLRLFYLDGLGIDQIAALFQIHRATVARRVLRLREEALKAIKHALPSLGAGSPSSHVRSLWRIAGSDMQVSVLRCLKDSLSSGPVDTDAHNLSTPKT